MTQRKKEVGRKRKREKVIGSILLFLLGITIGCGSRMPPPGKPDIDPPIIKITYPLNNDTIKDTLYVKYTCEDKSPIKWVKLYVDGRIFYTDTLITHSIAFKSDTLYDGSHNLILKAKDKWDNIGTSNTVKVITKNGKKKEEKDERMDREHKKVR